MNIQSVLLKHHGEIGLVVAVMGRFGFVLFKKVLNLDFMMFMSG